MRRWVVCLGMCIAWLMGWGLLSCTLTHRVVLDLPQPDGAATSQPADEPDRSYPWEP
jgi:hypothetical protein